MVSGRQFRALPHLLLDHAREHGQQNLGVEHLERIKAGAWGEWGAWTAQEGGNMRAHATNVLVDMTRCTECREHDWDVSS